MKTEVYNLTGKAVGEIELPEDIFGRAWNPNLVHQALLAQLGNRRQPLAHTKDRGDVRGGGKKPWRQKGTGRARHGSIRSPIWKGGGVTHGPRNDKDYSKKINRKMKRAAINSVLSKKLADGEIKIIDSFNVEKPKTKELYQSLSSFFKLKKKPFSSIVVPVKGNRTVSRAASNLPKVKSMHMPALNVYDLLAYKNVLIDKEAISEFVEVK